MSRKLTLGSLFDGVGGFPLAGKMAGITPVWATVILSPGASSTPRRVGASHKYGNVFLLSSILEGTVPERFSLSPKACQGILRRAEKRGKELPEVLRIALERQANG